MGNCQAIDTGSFVIQHPSGRVERLYWPVTATDVMKSNKGHYVALVLNFMSNEEKSEVNITRVKLLRPTDTLVFGQSYRLITSEEVMKGLWAKKYAKKKKKELELVDKEQNEREKQDSDSPTQPIKSVLVKPKANDPTKHERQRQKTTSSALAKSRHWRPSLHSISEAAV